MYCRLPSLGRALCVALTATLAGSMFVPAVEAAYNGVNLQPGYYAAGRKDPRLRLDAMRIASEKTLARAKIQAVRVEVSAEMMGNPAGLNTWLKLITSEGNVQEIILTYHPLPLATNDTWRVDNAATWWKNNYATIVAGVSKPVHINVINEWGGHDLSSDTYRSTYQRAIDTIRTTHPNPRVIIDISGYGQDAARAVTALGGTGFVRTGGKLSLSAHVYTNAWDGGSGQDLTVGAVRTLYQTCASKGVGFLLGEFGYKRTGTVNWAGIVDDVRNAGYGVYAWAWNGDGRAEGDDLNMRTEVWVDEKPTNSLNQLTTYGKNLINKL